jgi:hypothetical protein
VAVLEVSSVRFCCFVTYTVDGFKHLAVGDKDFVAELRGPEGDFDVPSALGLRPGQLLCRRQNLKATPGKLGVAYSQYLGASEINHSRPGSFLGITVVFEDFIDTRACNVSALLGELLSDLAPRVVEDGRFVREPDVDVLRGFINRKSSTLDLLGEAPALRGHRSNGQKPLLFCTSAKELDGAFHDICSRLASNSDFFIVQGTVAEFRTLPGYEVTTWPLPPPPPPPAPLAAGKLKPNAHETGSVAPLNQARFASSTGPRRANNDDGDVLEVVGDLGRRVTLLSYIVVCCILFSILTLGAAGWWLRDTLLQLSTSVLSFSQPSSLATVMPAQASVAASTRAPNEKVLASVVGAASQPAPSNPRQLTIDKRTRLRDVRERYCPGLSFEHFKAQLFITLVASGEVDTLPKGTTVILPAGCS